MTHSRNDSPVAIFARLFDPDRIDLSPEAAQALLKVTFDQGDRDRMHQLIVKNRDGNLTPEEEAELDSFLQVGCILDVMHAKAHLVLRNSVAAT
jgi:hypothetical protein